MFDYRPNYIDSSCHTHSIISSSTQSLNSRALAIGPIVIIIIIIILFFNKSACNRTAVDNYKFIRNTANLARRAGQPQLVRKPTPGLCWTTLGASARSRGRRTAFLANPGQTHTTANRQSAANNERKFTVPLRDWNRETYIDDSVRPTPLTTEPSASPLL